MNYKHGKGSTRNRLYRIWVNMKTRCFNPNAMHFEHYGGKGIEVCSEWLDFKVFYDWSIQNGYSDDLTIDRINPSGNYEPSNCRWVSYTEQNLNKECVPKYEYQEITFHQSETFSLFGIKRTTFQSRIKRGLSVEDALKGGLING